MVSPEQRAVGSSSLNQSEEAFSVPPFCPELGWACFGIWDIYLFNNVYIVSALCQMQMLTLHREQAIQSSYSPPR